MACQKYCKFLEGRITPDLYQNSFITNVHHSERKNNLQTFLTRISLPRSANKGSRNQHLSSEYFSARSFILLKHGKEAYAKRGDVIPKEQTTRGSETVDIFPCIQLVTTSYKLHCDRYARAAFRRGRREKFAFLGRKKHKGSVHEISNLILEFKLVKFNLQKMRKLSPSDEKSDGKNILRSMI